jgi:hypothetical protein
VVDEAGDPTYCPVPMRNLIFATLLMAGCNMTAFTANQTAKVIKAAAPSLQQESDLELAMDAAPGQLKTIEGFHLASPQNDVYIAILAQGYCEYAFGMIELKMLEARARKDEDRELVLSKRATGLYLRCMNYGLKLLGGSWEKALYGEMAAFEAKVKGADGDDVQGMFWTALGLASAINQNRDDISLVAYMPKAKMMFERVVALNPGFHNAGAHMALGMLSCAQPKALGGDPDRGKAEFEKAINLTGGKYLMPKVLMAIAYGGITNDREFFHKTLVQVLETSPAVYPDQRLANEIAHVRAKHFLAREKELF